MTILVIACILVLWKSTQASHNRRIDKAQKDEDGRHKRDTDIYSPGYKRVRKWQRQVTKTLPHTKVALNNWEKARTMHQVLVRFMFRCQERAGDSYGKSLHRTLRKNGAWISYEEFFDDVRKWDIAAVFLNDLLHGNDLRLYLLHICPHMSSKSATILLTSAHDLIHSLPPFGPHLPTVHLHRYGFEAHQIFLYWLTHQGNVYTWVYRVVVLLHTFLVFFESMKGEIPQEYFAIVGDSPWSNTNQLASTLLRANTD